MNFTGITYEKIAEVNKGMNTVDIKGKDYVVVPQRVKAFRQLYPEGFILTDIISNQDGTVVMQAKAGYYTADGSPRVLGSGLAFEKQDSSFINKTSYIENCETSAIGRALGFLGLGIDGAICSAEELVTAVKNQDKANAPVRPQKGPENGAVTTARTIPQEKKEAPNPAEKPPEKKPESAGQFMQRRIAEMKQEYAALGFDFLGVRKALIDGGQVPDIPSATMTMEQAEQLMREIEFFYEEKKAAS
jgi:hypothetical protein